MSEITNQVSDLRPQTSDLRSPSSDIRMAASGAMNLEPLITRIYTDEAVAQGFAWASQAALPNQPLWQPSLPTRLFPNRSIRSANDPALAPRRWSLDSFWPGIVQTHRPLASRGALLFAPCARSRKCQELAFRKSTGHARLAGMSGFLKRHLQACL